MGDPKAEFLHESLIFDMFFTISIALRLIYNAKPISSIIFHFDFNSFGSISDSKIHFNPDSFTMNSCGK